MDDQAGPGDEAVLHVQLELGLDRQPIRGQLRTERGTDEQFVGWIGFVDALKRLQERGDATPSRLRSLRPSGSPT